MYRIFAYRVYVVRKNLSIAFPSITEEERLQIEKQFYKSFIDLTLESIKGLSCPAMKLVNRFKLINPELMDDYYLNNESVILYSQHFYNWEWGTICLGLQTKHELVGIVKLLSNEYINEYIMSSRSGDNVTVVPSQLTHEYFNNIDKLLEPKAIVFLADQLPYNKQKSLKLPFLGTSTHFHHGAAYYAQTKSFPVICNSVRRIRRGYYEAEIFVLTENSKNHTAEELTTLYKNHLESLIKEDPSGWLWTHKRFKDQIVYS